MNKTKRNALHLNYSIQNMTQEPSLKMDTCSCVAIPCSFDYPSPGEEVTQFTGIWTDESGHVIYHPDTKKAMAQYRNRTNLLGDLLHKDCSLKIDPVQASDKGPYHFRIEIANFNKYSYKEKTVSITSTSKCTHKHNNMHLLFQKFTVAKCSVSHSCPPSPPHISWTHSGHVQVQHQEMGGALWRTTSTITFQPRRTDHKRELQCTVTHSGGRQQNASKVLSVKCKRYELFHIYTLPSVQEGIEPGTFKAMPPGYWRKLWRTVVCTQDNVLSNVVSCNYCNCAVMGQGKSFPLVLIAGSRHCCKTTRFSF
uniref:Ig-like domain-containing protein n=1 Tax=Neogobius melanostomus TaxID=47308 RepID=A0A8C6SN63_9GOBI